MLDMTGLLRKSFMLMDKKILLFLALSAAGYPLCSQAQSQFKLQTQEIKNADNEPAPVFPVPSDRQLKWNETEFYAFYHYGMNTYTDKEWGGGGEPESKFAPTAKPNPRQWLETAQKAGMKGGIAVVKHHDGFLLPAVSLGLWKNFGSQRPLSESRSLIHYAFDHGIVHFDLANNYGPPPGSAEETFGEIMQTSLKPYRDELFISTKAGYEMWTGPYGNWGSRKSLIASLNQSLQRMKLDYVDLFYTHRYDPQTPLEETLQALVDIVRQGKALYVGISRWPLEATKFAFQYLRSRDVPCLCYQGRLNLLDRAPVEEGILEEVQREGAGFVSFSPLAQGMLTNRYLNGIPADSRIRLETTLKEENLTPELLQKLQRLNDFAVSRGDTLAQLALRWVLQHEGVTSVIVGASKKEQLADNLRCVGGNKLSDEELLQIEKILY